MLNHSPLVLGGGESPFAGLDGLRLRPIEVLSSPSATHITYSTRDSSRLLNNCAASAPR